MMRNAYRTLLKREESYAVHALLYVAEHPGAPAARIAADLELPRDFLAKVLRRLGKAGFVHNLAGRTGGVRLAVDLSSLTLLDVLEAVSGPVVIDLCQTLERCPTQKRAGSCSLYGAWMAVSQQVRDAFAGVRLDTLVAPEARRPVPPA
jgi:Rrf2 family protein